MKCIRILVASCLLASIAGCGLLPTTPSTPPPPSLGKKTCEAIPGTQAGQYCHWRTCAVPKGTLWYQHGLEEDQNAPDAPATLVAPAHTEFPALAVDNCYDIVAMSWGKSWMIRPPGTAALIPPSPPWSEVNEKALPYIEQARGLVRPYIGYGQSMGGFNTAVIANLKPAFFDKLLITHPVITDFPDFAPPFKLATVLIGLNFTPQEWTVANPNATIKTVPAMSPAYVAACATDEFGLWLGPSAYALAAKGRGFDVTFHQESAPCKHTTLEIPPIVEWLKK